MTNAPLKGLEARREFRGMSQKAAGEIIGVTQSHYRQIEVGMVRLDIYRAAKLAEAFDCHIEDLL
jgi:DNA-binding XRE family transcriptional regulator